MERFLKRGSGAPARPSFDALPDELLLAVFQLVPEVTSEMLGTAVELQSSGPVERVGRRWRSFALQLPASLSIDFCQAHDLFFNDREVAAALERLLPHLACRRISALSIRGCTAVLAPDVPARLACALYPDLRRLHLSGSSLPHFTSFLPMCRRLEELSICTKVGEYDEGTMDPQLLCSHLCGLSCSLKLLELTTDLGSEPLTTTISRHKCAGSVPQSTWLCPHLTSLLVTNAKAISGPASGAARCTSLRQLQFERCSFVGGTFPASVCSALHQLSSLALCSGLPDLSEAPPDLVGLPPEFSQLSSLRQLVIAGASIKPPSVEAVRQLRGLTALNLRNCRLEDLPGGPSLSNLRSLDVSYNSDHLAFAIPFAATAARGLQALCIDFEPCNFFAEVDASELRQWWADMQWRLQCFPGLKVLCMDIGPEVAAEPEVHAVLEDIRSAIPPSCCLDLEGYLGAYPEYDGLAEFR